MFNYGGKHVNASVHLVIRSFDVNILSQFDISVMANTSLEECSDEAVFEIDRVRVNDMSIFLL